LVTVKERKIDPPDKALLFQADDFGYDGETNQRILASFLSGPIGCASLLVTQGAFSQGAVQIALKEKIPLGLHLNLTEGAPLSDLKKVPSLLGRDGKLLSPQAFLYRLRQGKIEPEEIRAETYAQLDKFLSFGLKPLHFDSHNHLHVMPGFFPIIKDLIKDAGFRFVRLPQERLSKSFRALPNLSRFLEIVFLASWSNSLRPLLLKGGFETNDHFSGIFEQEPNFNLKNILRMISEVSPGLTEAMVHPGHPGEMEVLTDERIWSALLREKVKLLKPFS